MGRSTLWSISWLRHQMFYSCVMISAAQACKSDDLRHAMLPFSLFLSFFLSFSGTQRILGYVRPRRIVTVHPPKTGKKRPHLWAASGGAFELGQPLCFDVIGLQMWPPKDSDPELRHSKWVNKEHIPSLSFPPSLLEPTRIHEISHITPWHLRGRGYLYSFPLSLHGFLSTHPLWEGLSHKEGGQHGCD